MGARKVGATKSVQWLPAPGNLHWPSTSRPVLRGCDVCHRNNGRARLVSYPCTLACISRTRHARSPQRVARAAGKSHSRLHFARSTRTISAEGCAPSRQIALSPAFRALDAHDLRRRLRAQPANRTLACISRARHARSPQRVARAAGKSHSRLHFAHSTRAISAEGCARTGQIALSPAFRALDTHDLRRGLRAQPANRTLACISRARQARSPQRVARPAGKSHSRLHFAHSTRAISAEGCAHSRQIALSRAFRALDTHDLRRGLRAQPANRTLACISRTRHARSPQRVARAPGKSHSRLHFAHSTRTISAEGCARSRQIALACISRTRHARSPQRDARAAGKSRARQARYPQRVARAAGKSHSRLHFAHSTRTISAEGCARSRRIALSPAFRALDTHDLRGGFCARRRQIALSPAFRALNTHDLRRGLRKHGATRALACISRTRHARSPQRVARAAGASHSRLHFAHSTRTISAEGCARAAPIALSPAFRALDTHDLRRGLHFRLTLFVPPSAFKREFIKWGKVFTLGHLPC